MGVLGGLEKGCLGLYYEGLGLRRAFGLMGFRAEKGFDGFSAFRVQDL